LVYEASKVVLPLPVRRSKLYQAIVGRLLRITVELIGGVEGVYPAQEMAELQLAARQEDRSILEISSMVAHGAVRAGVRLGSVHIFDYYRRALRTIVEEGVLSFLRRTSTPYLTRAGSHFDPRSSTYSERLLRRRADRRSPVASQTTPQAEASDEEMPHVAEAKGSSAHLILNPAAGSAAAFLGRLTEAARERGIRVRVLEPGEDARLAALEAADDGAESLAVAGGDGSVAAVAGAAVERDLPLVVVPTGTLNHFARDLGLDLARPLRALDAFDAGHERRVDVGRINGRPFVNNVSLGVYAEMLGDPGYRGAKLRVAQTKLQAAFSDPELRRALRITPPEEATLEGVVAAVVSNNPYEFARWDRFGQRRRLDTGTLQISALDAGALGELERLLAGTLLGTIEFRPALRHWTSERLQTGVLGEVVRAGVDGEPITLEAPLRFSVDPGALRVLVPNGLPADRPVPPLEAGWHAARTLRRWLRPTPGLYEDRRRGDDYLMTTT
jgi:diacylglycerol kinase family enzyme